MPVKPVEHCSRDECKARRREPRSGGMSSERGAAKRAGEAGFNPAQAIGQRAFCFLLTV